MRRAPGREGGYAIGIALVVLVLVASAATAIALGLQLEARTSQQESRRIHLVALSDAAMAEALAELDRSKSFTGVPERRFANGTISSSVRSLSADRFEIVATASLRGWERRVVAQAVATGSTTALVSWRIEP